MSSIPQWCVHYLGEIEYSHAWKLQDNLALEIAAGVRQPTLLLLEHPHTYTFGRRGRLENLLWDQAELQRRGVAVHWVDRGGDVTYHGPGQLVGYPLLALGAARPAPGSYDSAHIPQADYVGYIRKLEQALILCLHTFGVSAIQLDGLTGVWVPIGSEHPAKIAAIGVKVDARGITRHGFALNINTDSQYWQGIIGCGLAGTSVCNLAELLPHPPALGEINKALLSALEEVFGCNIIEGLTLAPKLSTL